MEEAVNFTRKPSIQRLINTLGRAINESCKKLDCKKANHLHLRLLPPKEEK